MQLRRRQLRRVDPARHGADRLRGAARHASASCARRGATSASVSARSSSRAPGRARSPPPTASPASTTSTRSASRWSPTGRSRSRPACSRTARGTRRRWRSSPPTSSASGSRTSRSSRATRPRRRTATGSYGSRTAVIGSGAIIRAAGDVRDKLVARRRAHVRGGERGPRARRRPHLGARIAGQERSRSARSRRPPTGARAPTDIDPALISTRSYDPPETYSNACIAVVVEIDAETGQVRDRAHRRRGGLRHGAQPDRRRRAGDRRDRAGDRRGAVRATALRRGRELPRRHARRLPLPDRDRGAGDRGRSPRDAVAPSPRAA